MKVLRDDLHVLTGSYALDALDDQEREEFERHLQHCPSCDAEVRGLCETAARMAMASAVAPPTRMEQRVLAAAYRTRQLPPLVGPRAQAAGPRTIAGPRSGRRLFAGRPGRVPRRVAAVAAAAAAWPWPSPSGSPRSPPSTSSSRRGRAAPRSPGWSPRPTRASRPRDERGRQRHRRHLRRPAGSRHHHDRAGIPARRAGLPGLGDDPSGARSAGLLARTGTLLASAVGARRPDRDNCRARGRDVAPDHHARRGPAP